jgi:hypothetical protein
METKLPFSQESATSTNPEPDESTIHPFISDFPEICFNIILPSMPRSSDWYLPFSYSNQYLVCIIISPVCAMYKARLRFLDFIMLVQIMKLLNVSYSFNPLRFEYSPQHHVSLYLQQILLICNKIQSEHKITLHFQNNTENKCGELRTSHLHQSKEKLSKFCTHLTETRYVLRESHGRCRDDNPTRPKIYAECPLWWKLWQLCSRT